MYEKILAKLKQEFPNAAIDLQVEGNRCLIQLVSDEFEGVTRVKRQQRVYSCLTDLLASGELHAVTIQAKTPVETQAS